MKTQIVVVGGGAVAERKVETLLGTEASIHIISPEVTPGLEALADSGQIQLQRRPYARGDCAGAALVFSATDDMAVSRAVFDEASAVGSLLNTADQPAFCDFIMPAVVRRGDIAAAAPEAERVDGALATLQVALELFTCSQVVA